MWTSVPQIVVSVTRMTASPGPGRGRGTSLDRDVAGAAEDGGPHGGRGDVVVYAGGSPGMVMTASWFGRPHLTVIA